MLSRTFGPKVLSAKFRIQLEAMKRAIDTNCPIIKLEKDNTDIISRIVDVLKSDGVIALPTDTVYGVACLAQSTKAVERIYEIKGRDISKPIAICVGEVSDVYKWGEVPSLAKSEALLNDIFPGPVTMVTKRTDILNANLNSGTELVGIRIPGYEFIRELANRMAEPLALTSANLSSEMSSLCINDFSALHSRLDLIVDGGSIGTGVQSEYARKGSTVFKIDSRSFEMIREGCACDATIATLRDKWGLALLG